MLVVNKVKTETAVGKVPQGTLIKYQNSYYILGTKSNTHVYIYDVNGNSSGLINVNELVTAYKATIHIEGVLNEV